MIKGNTKARFKELEKVIEEKNAKLNCILIQCSVVGKLLNEGEISRASKKIEQIARFATV